MLTNIFKRPVTMIRKVGAYVNYVWVNSGADTSTIYASVQPTPAEIQDTLPEGLRTRSSFRLFTNSNLLISETDLNNSDVVLLYGDRYFVAKKSIWENTSLSHYEFIVVKEQLNA